MFLTTFQIQAFKEWVQ